VEKTTWQAALKSVLLNKYYLCGQIKKKVISRQCGTHGREEIFIQFWLGNLREREHLEDLSIDGRIILICIFKKWNGGHGLHWSVSR